MDGGRNRQKGMEIKWRNSSRRPHPAGIQFRATPSSIELKLLHIKLRTEAQAVRDEDRNQNLLSPHQQEGEENRHCSQVCPIHMCECKSAKRCARGNRCFRKKTKHRHRHVCVNTQMRIGCGERCCTMDDTAS